MLEWMCSKLTIFGIVLASLLTLNKFSTTSCSHAQIWTSINIFSCFFEWQNALLLLLPARQLHLLHLRWRHFGLRLSRKSKPTISKLTNFTNLFKISYTMPQNLVVVITHNSIKILSIFRFFQFVRIRQEYCTECVQSYRYQHEKDWDIALESNFFEE